MLRSSDDTLWPRTCSEQSTAAGKILLGHTDVRASSIEHQASLLSLGMRSGLSSPELFCELKRLSPGDSRSAEGPSIPVHSEASSHNSYVAWCYYAQGDSQHTLK
mgnify:CR=1 FL=1